MCNQLAALLAEVVVASHALLTPLPPSIPRHPTCACAESIGCSLAEAAESPAYESYLSEAGATPNSLHVSGAWLGSAAGCSSL